MTGSKKLCALVVVVRDKFTDCLTRGEHGRRSSAKVGVICLNRSRNGSIKHGGPEVDVWIVIHVWLVSAEKFYRELL